MRQTVVRGVSSWSRWQPDRGLDFNAFFVETSEGNLVVDPLEPDEETLAELASRGVAAVLVTNRDHERATAAVAQATGAQVIASALDAPLLTQPVGRTVEPGDVVHGWTVLGFEGLKTAGEIALLDRSRSAAIVGDALWGKPDNWAATRRWPIPAGRWRLRISTSRCRLRRSTPPVIPTFRARPRVGSCRKIAGRSGPQPSRSSTFAIISEWGSWQGI